MPFPSEISARLPESRGGGGKRFWSHSPYFCNYPADVEELIHSSVIQKKMKFVIIYSLVEITTHQVYTSDKIMTYQYRKK